MARGTNVTSWAASVLACPTCHDAVTLAGDDVVCAACGVVGLRKGNVISFEVSVGDASIDWYTRKGGARFYERSNVPFGMSALDSPVYHNYLMKLRGAPDALVVDVGAGDGRNTVPWLHWGYTRVVAVDAVAESLSRLADRLQTDGRYADWTDRLLLIRADARHLPIRGGQADLVLAIESLYYLNDDYEVGLAECARILRGDGRLALSERSWEGALLTRLLYDGLQGMLEMRDSRTMQDGTGDDAVTTRVFLEEELLELLERAGLEVTMNAGISILPAVCGYLYAHGKITDKEAACLPELQQLLQHLGEREKMRRTHVIAARHRSSP